MEDRINESIVNDEISLIKEQITVKNGEIDALNMKNSQLETENASLKNEIANVKEKIANEMSGKIVISKEDFIKAELSGVDSKVRETIESRIKGESVEEIRESIKSEVEFIEKIRETIKTADVAPGAAKSDKKLDRFKGIASAEMLEKLIGGKN